jgi:hypothetical protein
MRHAAEDRHGYRLRRLVVVLWRAELSVQEALALAEQDLDHRRGSLLVRSGRGGRRREVGIDDWGWAQLRPGWPHESLPVGPLTGRRTGWRRRRFGCGARGWILKQIRVRVGGSRCLCAHASSWSAPQRYL